MISTPPSEAIERAYHTARAALLAERTAGGVWVGELSSSALSTATAIAALALVDKARQTRTAAPLIAGGLRWLAEHQNADGGWGDTVKSFSNISTTMLCRAAIHLADGVSQCAAQLERSQAWLAEHYGTTSAQLAEAIRKRYGKDRTFSVPILMTSALAGLVEWREVPSLPFELACLPQSWFRFLRLPVVSYALPALIAIGQAVFHHRAPGYIMRRVRHSAIGKSLRVLQAIQPSSGGFLEAAPLTSFVALGLASSGRAEHPVVSKCVEFLVNGVRPDGSWPIDTNLSTWVTTLAVNALASADDLECLDRRDELRDWILAQQLKQHHPFTGAAPGGWAWTPLPGGVPDADDTPGAILALRALGVSADEPSVKQAEAWLLHLQNGDGGMPTFCTGWTNLPFDRSGCDLTAHSMRALVPRWLQAVNRKPTFWTLTSDRERVVDFFLWCHEYLVQTQQPDGSWLPLWFGNQHAPDDINPTYGTAKVLAAYRDLEGLDEVAAQRGIAWLLSAQNADGGWGGAKDTPSSIEETALAVEVLHSAGPAAVAAVNNGVAWLVQRIEAGGLHEPTPIGFYFAKLWYFERLYPIIFSVAALGRVRRALGRSTNPPAITTEEEATP